MSGQDEARRRYLWIFSMAPRYITEFLKTVAQCLLTDKSQLWALPRLTARRPVIMGPVPSSGKDVAIGALSVRGLKLTAYLHCLTLRISGTVPPPPPTPYVSLASCFVNNREFALHRPYSCRMASSAGLMSVTDRCWRSAMDTIDEGLGGVEVHHHIFFTSVLGGSEGPASRPGRSYPPPQKRPLQPLRSGFGGPHSRSGRCS
jgi:hypothetical protein